MRKNSKIVLKLAKKKQQNHKENKKMKRFHPRLMIRWRLRTIMADRKINNKVLSEKTGIPYSSLSRLKNSDELKNVNGDILNALCHVLDCTPSDLIEFVRDDLNANQSQSESIA